MWRIHHMDLPKRKLHTWKRPLWQFLPGERRDSHPQTIGKRGSAQGKMPLPLPWKIQHMVLPEGITTYEDLSPVRRDHLKRGIQQIMGLVAGLLHQVCLLMSAERITSRVRQKWEHTLTKKHTLSPQRGKRRYVEAPTPTSSTRTNLFILNNTSSTLRL